MLDAHHVYEIAKKYQAEITADRQIQWLDMGSLPGDKWVKHTEYRPSVMDAVILDQAWKIPGYLSAAKAATGWTEPMVMGFLQGMYLGQPLETVQMKSENFPYWKGMLIGLMVIQKLKSRLWEAESLFS